MHDFWKHQAKDRRTISWDSWDTLCRPKMEWGLGLYQFEAFNQALLAHAGWCLIQNPQSLYAYILRAKYYPTTDFMLAIFGRKPSYLWCCLLWGRTLLQKGVGWQWVMDPTLTCGTIIGCHWILASTFG